MSAVSYGSGDQSSQKQNSTYNKILRNFSVKSQSHSIELTIEE